MNWDSSTQFTKNIIQKIVKKSLINKKLIKINLIKNIFCHTSTFFAFISFDLLCELKVIVYRPAGKKNYFFVLRPKNEFLRRV